MGFFDGLLDFAGFHGKDVLGAIKDNPERAFLGALDPASTKMWGSVLGKDWDPAVSMTGGATQDQFNRAEQQGIDTGPSRNMGAVADTISSIWGGNAAMGALGGLGSGGSSGGLYSEAATGPSQGGWYGNVETGGVSQGGLLDRLDPETLKQMSQMMQQQQGQQQQEQQQGQQLAPLPRSQQTVPMPGGQELPLWQGMQNLPRIGLLSGGSPYGLR